jgi:hypothetical protein
MGMSYIIKHIKLYINNILLTCFSFVKNFIKNVLSNPASSGSQYPINIIKLKIINNIDLPFCLQKLNLSSLCLNFLINSDALILIVP